MVENAPNTYKNIYRQEERKEDGRGWKERKKKGRKEEKQS